ncbi:MAG: SIMPL domain-containing protein [Patescibacteria group bacterium]
MEKENKICPESCQDCVHKMMKVVALVLMVLALFLLVKTYGALKVNKFIGQDIYPQNTIMVTGEGEISATPDIATFSFSVVEEGDTVEAAQKIVNEKMASALDFLKTAGVEEKDIKTTGYNIYPKYEWWSKEVACSTYGCPTPERQQKIVGYEVNQNVTVKLSDINKAGEILSGLGSTKVSNLSGLTFDIDNKDDLMRQAREDAIKEAKSKAKDLAKDLGVDLVRMVSYSSNEGNDYPPYYEMSAKAYGMGGDAISSATASIPTGENEIKVMVYITYEIK